MGLPTGIFNRSYEEDMAIFRTKTHWFYLMLGLAFACILPLSGAYVTHFTTGIGIIIIAVIGLNILTGYCGQISIGHAAFVAVGAYTTAILSQTYGLNSLLALICGALSAGAIGLIFGLPSLRVKGFYLLMATLAAQFIIIFAINRLPITGGTVGFFVGDFALGNLVLDTEARFYYLTLICVIISLYFATNLIRGKAGRAFIAVRDNDLAAEVMGINIYAYKLLAFFVGCTLAGFSGGLLAFWQGAIISEGFDLAHSIWYLGYLIVGGMGSIVGPIFGVVFIRVLEELLSFGLTRASAVVPNATQYIASASQVLFGGIIALFLIFQPRGLHHRWLIFKASCRLWPFCY